MRLHHVQVACPTGGEDEARRFYAHGLGMTEVDKPTALAARGGCWFRAYDDQGSVAAEIHIGVEDRFIATTKAHPALLLDDEGELEKVAEKLAGLGFEVDWSQRHSLEDLQRFHTRDAHGNRVEVLSPR